MSPHWPCWVRVTTRRDHVTAAAGRVLGTLLGCVWLIVREVALPSNETLRGALRALGCDV
jgi:hypothetical protein